MGLMKAEQSRTGGRWCRGDLLSEGTGLSPFLITTNRSQFYMTTSTAHLGQCLYYKGGVEGSVVIVPLGLQHRPKRLTLMMENIFIFFGRKTAKLSHKLCLRMYVY